MKRWIIHIDPCLRRDDQDGQTILEYVLILAMSIMIILIISKYTQGPLSNITSEYTKSVKKVVEEGDLKYGRPEGFEENKAKRFQYI